MEANNITIAETIPASRKLQGEDAAELLKSASKLIAMKGKKVVEFTAKDLSSEDAVASMLGPTGNMRAPTIRVGKTYLVGFNEEVFNAEFS